MPTENRSSSTEMVSVPRELAEFAAQALSNSGYDLQAQAMKGALAQQNQGEPVAYLCKSEGANWLQYGSKVGDPWKPGEVEVTPLYTHADPDEAEWSAMQQRLGDQNETLRSQLAERNALLREVLEFIDDGVGRSDAEWQLIQQVRAALSASAEPSALSDCAICRDLGNQCMECEEGEFREWADRHFAAADYRKTDAGVFIQDWMRHAYGAWCARGALAGKQ